MEGIREWLTKNISHNKFYQKGPKRAQKKKVVGIILIDNTLILKQIRMSYDHRLFDTYLTNVETIFDDVLITHENI